MTAPLSTATPHRLVVEAGSQLWRIHPRDREPTEFRDTPTTAKSGGGRFDATVEDPFPFLYAAEHQHTAFAEILLRSRPFDEDGYRHVPLASLRYRRLSAIRTTRDLTLLSLVTTVDLAAVAQDEWLVTTEEQNYGLTRKSVVDLRRLLPPDQGLIWQSRRDRPYRSMLLFGDRDRCGPDALVAAGPSFDLADCENIAWVNDLMSEYRLVIGGC